MTEALSSFNQSINVFLARTQDSFRCIKRKWKSLRTLEQCLLVICFLLTLLVISLLLKTFITPTKVSDECYSTECEQTALKLAKSMDLTVNPCDDFYEFTCGFWSQLNPIPKDQPEWSVRSKLFEQIFSQLKTIIIEDDHSDDMFKDMFTNVRNYYKACSNEGHRNKSGVGDLMDFLNQHYGWPILERKWEKTHLNYNWQSHFVRLNKHFQANYLMKLSLKLTNERFMLRVEPSCLGVHKSALKGGELDEEDQKKLRAYKKFIQESVRILIAHKQNRPISDGTRRRQDTRIALEIENLIKFEQSLVAIMKDNPKSLKIPFDEFHQLTGIELKTMANEIYADHLKFMNEQTVEVIDLDYFIKLSNLLKKFSSGKVANYLAWRTVELLAPSTNSEFRQVIFEFTSQTQSVQKMMTYEKACLVETIEIFKDLLGYAYISKHYNVETQKQVESIVRYIRSTMLMSFQWLDWLDEETRMKLQMKIILLKTEIGIPDKLASPISTKKFYSKLSPISSDNYFKAYMHILKWWKSAIIDLEVNSIEYIDWDPNSVIALYFFKLNTLAIPAALQQSPYFSPVLPSMVNFATIGSIIGHEFFHSIDPEGIELDSYAQRSEWSNETIKEEYMNRTKCFIDHFDKYVEPNTELNLDGTLTLNENLADHGGLALTYYAYHLYQHVQSQTKELMETEDDVQIKRLPHPLNNFNAEQQFFIAFASTLCTNLRPETIKYKIKNSNYCPNKFRVNGALSNFEPFAKAFQCKPNSPMNPINKCHLW